MKKSDPRRFRSRRELRLYRQNIEIEIQKTELDFHTDITELTATLSPVNILKAVLAHISTIRIVSTALSVGKKLFFSRKKKKKKGKEEEGDA
jgi:hypothetical protein